MSVSRILKGTHSRDIGRQLFGFHSDFSGIGTATISALLQIFGNFELAYARRKEATKPRF